MSAGQQAHQTAPADEGGAAQRPAYGGALLVPIDLATVPAQMPLLDFATLEARKRVYLFLTGALTAAPLGIEALAALTHCFEPSAHLKPRQDVVPLLPCAGWTAERAALLLDAEQLVAAEDAAEAAGILLQQLNAVRAAAALPSLRLALAPVVADTEQLALQQQQQQQQQQQSDGPAGTGAGSGQKQQQQQQPEGVPLGRVLGGWPAGRPLLFSRVAVGGTFDRLHAGHRLLLAVSALVSTQYVFVGVTADQLLANKRNRELLEDYAFRTAAAVNYMRAVNPGIEVLSGPLCDPKDPTVAATDPTFEALVVSEETIHGALAINQYRVEHGFKPLVVIVVGLIRARKADVKLSSTDLRSADADAASSAGGSMG